MASNVLVIEDHTRDLKLPSGVEQGAREGIFELWNAPRPFSAHEHYNGEFMHGVHYGIIWPNKEYADQMRRDAQRDDAHLVEFVAKEDVLLYRKKLCDEYGVDVSVYEYSEIITSYVMMRRRDE